MRRQGSRRNRRWQGRSSSAPHPAGMQSQYWFLVEMIDKAAADRKFERRKHVASVPVR